jgi:hypothetical protein
MAKLPIMRFVERALEADRVHEGSVFYGVHRLGNGLLHKQHGLPLLNECVPAGKPPLDRDTRRTGPFIILVHVKAEHAGGISADAFPVKKIQLVPVRNDLKNAGEGRRCNGQP